MKTAAAPSATRKTRAAGSIKVPVNKAHSFAVGVSPMHYWVITAIASQRGWSRHAVLEEMLAKHFETNFVGVKE